VPLELKIGSLQVHTGYITFSLNKTVLFFIGNFMLLLCCDGYQKGLIFMADLVNGGIV